MPSETARSICLPPSPADSSSPIARGCAYVASAMRSASSLFVRTLPTSDRPYTVIVTAWRDIALLVDRTLRARLQSSPSTCVHLAFVQALFRALFRVLFGVLFGVRSDSDGVGGPNHFVHLDLHAHRQLVGQKPSDEIFGRELSEDGARQDFWSARNEAFLLEDGAHPFVVGAVGQHELELVVFGDSLEIRPAISRRFA